MYSVTRSVFNHETFSNVYLPEVKEKRSLFRKLCICLKSFCPCCAGQDSHIDSRCQCCYTCLTTFVPCIDWLRHYKIKDYIAGDVLAGITVAILMIPQGMAYSQLASLEPVYGLYASFFSLFIYFLLGTSRQISVAPVAIIGLMTGAIVDANIEEVKAWMTTNSLVEINSTLANDSLSVTNASSSKELSPASMPAEVLLATASCFVCGIFQITMSILRLGFLTLYLSDSVIEGFMTGAVVHIITSQLKFIFGLNIQKHQGPLKVIRTLVEIIRKLPETRVAELIISVCCILVLYVVKEFVNKKFKAKLKVPVPIDFIVTVIVTALSYSFSFHEKFEVDILLNIPTGIPQPSLPPVKLLGKVAVDAFAMAIVAYALTVAIAKNYARKHGYKTDSSQELFALGVGSIVSSLFQGFASAAAFSRSIVQDSLGGKTQIASAVASSLILIVLLALGPLLEPLPKAVLATIIIVALKNTLDNYKLPIKLWRECKIDFYMWVVTYLSVIFLEVHSGLIVGVAFSMLCFLVKSQHCKAVLLGRIPDTDIYCDATSCSSVQQVPFVRIFRFEGSLFYANAELFTTKITSLVGLDAKCKKGRKLPDKADEVNDTVINNQVSEPAAGDSLRDDTPQSELLTLPVRCIIIDCSMFTVVDYSGVCTLRRVIEQYENTGIVVYLSNCRESLTTTLEGMNFFSTVPKSCIFLTNHDAVLHYNFHARNV